MTGRIKQRKEIRPAVHPVTAAFVNSLCGILKSKDGSATEALLKEHRKEIDHETSTYAEMVNHQGTKTPRGRVLTTKHSNHTKKSKIKYGL